MQNAKLKIEEFLNFEFLFLNFNFVGEL